MVDVQFFGEQWVNLIVEVGVGKLILGIIGYMDMVVLGDEKKWYYVFLSVMIEGDCLYG